MLLIGDNELLREALVASLRDDGHHVIEGNTMPESCELIDCPSAVLVIIDGTTVRPAMAHRIRAQHPGLPIVLITTDAMVPSNEERSSAVVYAPFEYDQLHSVLHQLNEGPGQS